MALALPTEMERDLPGGPVHLIRDAERIVGSRGTLCEWVTPPAAWADMAERQDSPLHGYMRTACGW